MKIPQGYKQTELGVIPEDWNVMQISDFTSVVTGGTPNTQHPEYWGGNIRWMNSGELNLKFIYNVENRITEDGLNNSSTRIIPAGCVLVGLAGQGKTRGTAAYNFVSLCTNQSIAAFLPTDKHSSLYLYYIIDNQYDFLRLLSSGDGGRGGLNKQILSSLNVILPPYSEQRAIAKALSDVDALIAALDKKIAKKRLIKQGAMQQLLTGKKRLQGFSEKWIVVKVRDIFEITRGYVLPTFKLSQTKSGPFVYPVYSSQTANNGILGYYDNFLFENCITWTTDGANAGEVNYRNGRFYCTNVCGVLRNSQGYANLCVASILNMCAGNYVSYIGNPKLMNNVMADIEIKIPVTIQEQQKIATILSDMDKEIADLEARRNKYKLIKSGMMQKLLTGQIRLVKPLAPIIPLETPDVQIREIPLQTHVVAGHIVNALYQSSGWGRTKLQKTLHLVGYHCQLDFGNDYIRNTAGPDDQAMMNHIDSKFKQYRHVRIEVKKENGKTRYNYIPTAMIDELEQVYETYPQTIRHAVDSLINKIKKMDLACAEIVSTLYAVWNNRIIKGEPISDDLLLEDFYAWSKHKLDFSPDQVLCELNYMRKEEIIPIGWGKYIDKK